jgi:hypothetical protein
MAMVALTGAPEILMHSKKFTITLVRALTLGASLSMLEARALASPFRPQTFVDLQSSTPGTQQAGNTNISGTGIFGTALGIGTSLPLAGLHVAQEPSPPGGTFALEGVTTTYMTFFPQGASSGRKGYLGMTSPSSPAMWLANEASGGHIILSPGPFAGVGVNIPPTGNQMLKVYTSAANGYGVFAESTYGSGSTYGVFGRSYSTSGFGMYGLALSTTGTSTGVAGRSDSTTGRGVYGYTTKTTGTNYGVYAYCGSSQGYALYGQGRFAATGTKSFVIDHPFDPEGMTLSHYCTEGAEPLNVYRGNVVLNDRGEAWVSLPDYFEEINKDPSYTLTAVGSPMPALHIAAEVHQNRFQVAGGRAGGKISWRVEAVRNDRFVQTYGAPVEQVKPVEMRGKYLSPELYGQPIERGIQYVEETEAPRD